MLRRDDVAKLNKAPHSAYNSGHFNEAELMVEHIVLNDDNVEMLSSALNTHFNVDDGIHNS